MAPVIVKQPYLVVELMAVEMPAIAVAVVAWPLVLMARSSELDTLLLLTLLWALMIAGMLWQGASRALEAADLQHRIDGLDAAALAQPVRLVAPTHPLGELGDGPELDRVLILEPPARAASHPADLVGRAHRIHPEAARAVPDDRDRKSTRLNSSH